MGSPEAGFKQGCGGSGQWGLRARGICGLLPSMTGLPMHVAASVTPAASAVQDPSEGNVFMLVAWVSVALIFSFLCSIWEAVLLSTTGGFIASEKEQGKSYATKLEGIKLSIDRPLAGILTLNTIAHTVGASQAGAYAARIFDSVWLGIFTAGFTILILLGSEIIPKTIGATYWRTLAPFTTWSVRALTLVLFPIVWSCELITRMIGGGHGHSISREEYAAMVGVVTESGHMEEDEGRIIQNLLQLRDTPAESVATPKAVIFSCPDTMTVAEFVRELADEPFSRIPLYVDRQDDLDHFVLKDDILLAEARDESSTMLRDLQRPLLSVPEERTIYKLFQQLIEDKQHIAAVRDEFGSVVGLVTLEDVVETLLGLEIVDEGDKAENLREKARVLWEKRAREKGHAGF